MDNEEKNYLSLQEATNYCGYSQEYLSLRARHGKLKAMKFGRNWVTKKEWLDEYLKKTEEYNNNNNNNSKFNHAKKIISSVFVKTTAGNPPGNLPVEKIPVLRFSFVTALVFILLTAGITFGKESFKNVFDDASPLVQGISQGFDRGMEDFVYTVGTAGDIIVEEIGKSVGGSFENIGYQSADIGNVFKDYGFWLSQQAGEIIQGYNAANNFVEQKLGNFAGNFKKVPQAFVQGYKTANNFVEEKLNQTAKGIKENYLAANKFIEEKLAQGYQLVTQPFVKAYQFVTSPWKAGKIVIEEKIKGEELEALQKEVKQLKEEGVVSKEVTKEVSKVTQIEPIKEITKETVKIDEESVAQLKTLQAQVETQAGQIGNLQQDMARRPTGLISAPNLIQPVSQQSYSPKLYVKNGSIVLEVAGSGSIIFSAPDDITASSRNFYIGGNLIIAGTQTYSGTASFTASSTVTALNVTQNGTGNIVEFKDGGTSVFTIADGGYATFAIYASTTPAVLIRSPDTLWTQASSTYFAIAGTSTFDGRFIDIQKAGASLFYVDGSGNIIVTTGNVGIGTTAPSFDLELSGARNPDGVGQVTSSTDPQISEMDGPASVFVSGDYAYVAASAGDALAVIDISDPANPVGVGQVTSSTDPQISEMDGPRSVFVSGNYAYVTGYTADSLVVIDISDPANPDGVGQVTSADPQIPNMDGPRSVYVSGNYAYVANAIDDSLVVIDISDPTNPDGVGQVTKADPQISNMNEPSSIYISGNYAYVACYQNNALVIIDISDPANPDGVGQVTMADPQISEMDGPRSVFVSGNYAYVTGSVDDSLAVIDISDPANPDGVGQVTKADPQISSMDQPYSVYVSGNYAYVASVDGNSLAVIDISDPANPVGVGQVTKADPQISEMNGPYSVYISGNYAYVAAGAGDALAVIKITGAELPAAQIGSLKAGSLQVMDNLQLDNDLYIQGGVTAINALFSGDVGIYNSGASPALTVIQNGAGNIIDFSAPLVGSSFAMTGAGAVNLTAGTDLTLVFATTSAFDLRQGGTIKLSIDQDGNLSATGTSITIAGSLATSTISLTAATTSISGTTTFMDGRVGIGTTTPASTLGVYGTSTFTGGYVGIGTTTPFEALTIQGNIYGSGNAVFKGTMEVSTTTVLADVVVKGNLVPYNSDGIYYIGSGSPIVRWDYGYFGEIDALNISAASTTIGGTTAQTFTINSDAAGDENSYLAFYRGGALDAAVMGWASSTDRFEFNFPIHLSGTGQISSANSLNFVSGAASTWTTNGLTINSTGDITATTTENIILTLGDAAGAKKLYVTNSSGATTTALFTIASDGKVGIGTTTPATTLGIYGTSTFMGGYVGIATTTPSYPLTVVGNIWGSGNIVLADTNATSVFQGALTVYGTTTLGQATSSPTILTGYIQSHIIPYTHSTYDLGTANLKWRNLYVSTTTIGDTVVIGTDSITATGTLAVTTGNALNITANSASTWQIIGNDLTIRTATSGTLALTSAGIFTQTYATTSTYTLYRGGETILAVDANGGVGLTARGTNQTISLTPSGTGYTYITRPVMEVGGTLPATSTATSGQMFFSTSTYQLYVYTSTSSRWQADRTVATKIVAATSSQNYEKADYVCAGASCEDEINTAINSLPAGGGAVYLLEGTYNISTSTGNLYGIQIAKSNVSIIGSGKSTILKRMWDETVANNSGVITVGDGSSAYEGIFISQLQIDGNKATSTNANNHAIFFKQKISRSQIKSTWIYNSAGDGIRLYAASAVNANSYNLIEGNDVKSNSIGIHLNWYSSSTTITGNTIQGNTANGISLYYSTSNNTITGNTILGNTVNGIYIYSSSDNTIAGNTFQGSGSPGISPSGNIIVNSSSNNNTITGNTSQGSGRDGIFISSNSNNNTVTGNTVQGSAMYGIFIETSNNNAITGNKIYNSGYDGIYIYSNSDANLISSNDITDTGGSSYYAINIGASTCDNNYLVGNRYSGTGANSIQDLGTGTIYGAQLYGTAATADLILKPLGNIGIGATSTSAKLTVLQSSTGIIVDFKNATGSVFTIANNGNVGISGDVTLAANKNLILTGGSSLPASPVEGEMSYSTTTKLLYIYSNGKWQADRTVATKIVAATSSQNYEKADYVCAGVSCEDEIQTALNSLPSTGGVVYLLDGTYTMGTSTYSDCSIKMSTSTSLIGAGASTILKLKDSFNATVNIICNSDTSAGNSRIYISQLKLDGNKANNSGVQYGIYFTKVGSGSGSTALPGAKIQDIWVDNFTYVGIKLSSSNNNTITGNTIQGSSSFGIMLSSSNNNTITGNTIQGNWYGTYISLSSYNTITGNTVQGNNGGSGIFLPGSSNYNTITGNTVQGNALHGISLEGDNYNTITGNKIDDNGGSGNYDGIKIDANSDFNLISSNDITDTQGGATAYAIEIAASTCDNNYLVGNRYSGTGANSIQDLGTGTIYGSQLYGSAATADLILKPLGNVGIGATSTSAKLTVYASSSNSALTITQAGTGYGALIMGGNVGIGTTAPAALLDVYASSTATTTYIYQGGLGAAFVVRTQNVSEAFVVREPKIEMNLPLQVNVGGNVGFAYDIEFSDPDAAKIISAGNLSIEAGTPGKLQNLTLKTVGTGNILFDIQNAVSNYISGFKVLGSNGYLFTVSEPGQAKLRSDTQLVFGEVNQQVLDDFEDGSVSNWISSDFAYTTTTATTTQVKVHNYSVALEANVGSSTLDIATSTPSIADWSGHERLGFWIRGGYTTTSTSATTTQIISVMFHDTTGTTSSSTVTIQKMNEWQYQEWDISGIAVADRDVVNWYGFRIDNDYGSPRFYIDQIRLYDANLRAGEIFVDNQGNTVLWGQKSVEIGRTSANIGSLPSIIAGTAVVELNQPLSVNVGGDVGFDYDIFLANTGLSTISSEGPFKISAGDANHYENLTLTTGGTGDVLIDIADSNVGFKVVSWPSGGYITRVTPAGNFEVSQNISTMGGNLTLNQLSTTSAPTFNSTSTGGSCAVSTTYYYRITVANENGETLPSASTSVAIGAEAATVNINLTWVPVPGATKYYFYRSTSSGFGSGSTASSTYVTATSTTYADDCSGDTNRVVPSTNTTGGVLTTAGGMIVAGNILPATTTTYTLGSADYKWANIYTATATIGNTIILNTNSITATSSLNITTAAASTWQTTGTNSTLTIQSASSTFLSSSNTLFASSTATTTIATAAGNIILVPATFLGIGTSTPASLLSVYGTSTFMGGNLGIGTTAPGYKLEVAGTGYYLGTLGLGGGTSITGGVFTFDQATAAFSVNALRSTFMTGNVGIGTISPAALLDVYASSTATTTYIYQGGLGAAFVVRTQNVADAFVVKEPNITMNLPLQVNVEGNVGFAYDIEFTDPDLAKIISNGNLSIEAGTPGRLQDLSLKTKGTGNIVADISNAAAGIGGFKVLGANGLVMRAGEPQVEFYRPISVDVGGDVGFDYDIYFANGGPSQITSAGPLAILAGDSNHSENLTLGTQGTGDVIVDIVDAAISYGGFKILGSDSGSYVIRISPLGDVYVGGTGSGGSDLWVKQNITQQGGFTTIQPLNPGEAEMLSASANANQPPAYCSSTSNFYYRLTALNDNGETTPSAPAPKVTPADATSTISVAWNPISGATKYKLYRYTGKLVEDAEDPWSAGQDASTTVSTSSDGKVGSYSAKVSATTTATVGLLSYENITDNTDLSTQYSIAFWIKSSITISRGDLKLLVDEEDNCTSSEESLDIPALGANVWKFVKLSFANTTTTRDSVDCVGLSLSADQGPQDVYIDDVNTSADDYKWVGGNSTTYINAPSTSYTDNCTSTDTSASPPAQNTTGGKIMVYRGADYYGSEATTTAFSVGDATVNVGYPLNVTTGGDVGISYDLQFLNTAASYITSVGPLWIQAGSPNIAQNLVLTVAGESGRISGDVIVDVRYSNQTSGGFKVIGSDGGGYVFRISPSGDVEIGGTGSGGSDLTLKQNMNVLGGNLALNQLATTSAPVLSTTTSGYCTAGAKYYRITVGNDNGQSIGSATSTITASAGNTDTVVVSWDGSTGATKHFVWRSVDTNWGDNDDYRIEVAAPTTVYSDTCTTTQSTSTYPTVNTTGGYFLGYFASSTVGVSSNSALCWDGSEQSYIVDCNSTPADIAEFYGTADATLEAGDVVVVDSAYSSGQEQGGAYNKAFVKKSTQGYEDGLVGAVSTAPYESFGKAFGELDNPRPIALVGRAPVKVSNENGPIIVGDFLTSASLTPGTAMKATAPGRVIGIALENFDGATSSTGKVLFLANLHWYGLDLNTRVTNLENQPASQQPPAEEPPAEEPPAEEPPAEEPPAPEPVCGNERLDLCTTQELCEGVSLYWYNNVCNLESEPPVEAPVPEP